MRQCLWDGIGVGAAADVFGFAVGEGDGGGGVGWCDDGALVVGAGAIGGDEAVGGVVCGVEGGEGGVELGADGQVMEAGACGVGVYAGGAAEDPGHDRSGGVMGVG